MNCQQPFLASFLELGFPNGRDNIPLFIKLIP